MRHLNKPHDNHMHTQKKPRAETQNIKKQEVEKYITENHQAKMANGNKEKETMEIQNNQKTKDGSTQY